LCASLCSPAPTRARLLSPAPHPPPSRARAAGNYACSFCFHTEKTREHAPAAELKRAISLVAAAGAKKLNFAGGEPLLFKPLLGELLAHARGLGLYTSVITNGALLERAWLADHARSLDMLGVSFDSARDATNFAHGRWPRKGGLPAAPAAGADSRAGRHLLRAAALAAEFGVPLKVNTVVTRRNAGEDVSALINAAAPARWKVFQVLALDGENCGAGAKADVAPLLVDRAAFDAFLARNRAGLRAPGILKEEPNEVMQASYVLLDERARFLDSSRGGKVPTQSILDVGVEAAAAELLASGGGGFDHAAFVARDGAFFAAPPAGAPAPPAPPAGAPAPPAAPPAPPAPPAAEAEVEVKFAPPPQLPATLARLARGAPRVTTFVDAYYDTADHRLSRADHWLRERDGALELKSPSRAAARAAGELRVDFYDEDRALGAVAARLARLGVALPPAGGAAPDALARAGLACFARLETRRARHALAVAGHEVHVDVDEVRFGGAGAGAPPYAVAEVELLAPARGAAPRAALREVLAALGVHAAAPPVRGKVLEFISRFDAARWAALGESGLLADKLGGEAARG